MAVNGFHTMHYGQTRKIRPTRRSVSGVYAFRGKTPIPFESTLERDFLIRAEFSLNVEEVVSQPTRVPFVGSNGQDYLYTPDFLVRYRAPVGGTRSTVALIEVKPEADWRRQWREWLPKWKAAWRYAQEMGWQFHVHDESRIRDQVLTNIRFLDVYKRMRFGAEDCRRLVSWISDAGPSPLHRVCAATALEGPLVGTAQIWHLLSTRLLDCDMSRPLNESTELWVPVHG